MPGSARLGRGRAPRISLDGPAPRASGGVVSRGGRGARLVVAVAAAAVALLVWAGMTASEQLDPLASLPAAPSVGDLGDVAGGEAARERDGGDRASRGAERDGVEAVFARSGELALVVPHRDVRLVAFGEANGARARALAPSGELVANESPTRYVPGEDEPGPPYVVLPSRGEPWPATGTAEVLLPLGTPVAAPVDGEVLEVADYPLPDGQRDVRVRIAPEDDPALAVELRHLTDVDVVVGDEVAAGATRVGTVRSVDVALPSDAVGGAGQAAVRVEVRPARGAGPPDPNATAEPAAH